VNQAAEAIRDNYTGQPQVLLMEDEFSVAQGLQMVLKEEGYGVDLAMTGQSALDTLNHKAFDLLVADLRLPDMDGMDVIKRVKDERPETEVIVITGYGNVPSAVEAIKTGVVDYLPKPFTDDEFKAAVEGALKEKEEVTSEEPLKLVETDEEKLIQKREVIRVLKRAPEDDDSLYELRKAGSRASIAARGLKRTKEHIGKLTQKQLDASDFTTKSIDEKAIIAGLDRAWEGYRAVTEERWAEIADELSRTFNFQNILIESSIDGIMGCNRDGTIITFNKSLERLLGYSPNEVCGKMSFDQFFQKGDGERFREKLYSEECGGKNRLLLFETNLVDKTGNRIPVQLSATVMCEGNEEIGIVAFFRDLREIRKVEQEFTDQSRLLQQHKMISLGRLAASVVHEINNPLAGILNYLRLMIKIIKRGSPDQEHMEKFQRYLDLVESETGRCSEIVSNLLAFSRKSKMEFGEVDIHELLEKSIMLSQHKMDLQNIQVKTEMDANIPHVWGDFNQIQQCVINLIFNSIDAMPDGGVLTVGCTYNQNKEVVEIRVEDTGSGISEEDLPHIFEPFYTTKAEGNGLGLGLATVYGIIDRHKGTIGVDSELGRGTIFTIRLPLGKRVI
jgi:PAS domain S-box-containing protein